MRWILNKIRRYIRKYARLLIEYRGDYMYIKVMVDKSVILTRKIKLKKEHTKQTRLWQLEKGEDNATAVGDVPKDEE